jgi:killing trait domain-containing protein
MATPASIVAPQITDAVTTTNVTILGSVPGNALGNLYQATAQAVSNAAHNATAANQNANTVLQATTTQGVALLYGVDTAATAVGISEILGSNTGGGRTYP